MYKSHIHSIFDYMKEIITSTTLTLLYLFIDYYTPLNMVELLTLYFVIIIALKQK